MNQAFWGLSLLATLAFAQQSPVLVDTQSATTPSTASAPPPTILPLSSAATPVLTAPTNAADFAVSSAAVQQAAVAPSSASPAPPPDQPALSSASSQPAQTAPGQSTTQAQPAQAPAQATPAANTPIQAVPVQSSASTHAAPAQQPAVAPAKNAVVSSVSSTVLPSSATEASLNETQATPFSSAAASVSSGTPETVATETANRDTTQTQDSASASGGDESPKLGMTGSISVGLVSLNGEQVTRISYRPEFTFGPLGVALDLELFIASDGHFKSTGWQFDTRDQTINSLYRKIYYIRLFQPGDPFYIRVGALEGITMDAAGLVTSNFGNVANYPGQKLVGVHVQFNDWFEPFGLSLEAVNNSLEDWNHRGGVLGTKLSAKPIGFTSIPILQNLRLGAMFIRDFNQLATAADKDNDNCPDEVDDTDGAGCQYATSYIDNDNLEEAIQSGDSTMIVKIVQAADSVRDASDSAITRRFGHADAFTMFAFDYLLPLFHSEFLGVDLYGEYARPYYSDDTLDLNSSYGLVPAGVSVKVWKLDLGLEYRRLNGRFQAGYFDEAYEMQRLRFINGQYVTKEESYWYAAEDHGVVQGVYGRASMDVFGFLTVGGSYYHLVGDDDYKDRGYTSRAALGPTLLGLIPKISLVEAFYNKDHLYTDGDDFFDRSIYTTYGYRLGFNLGGGMTVIVGDYTTCTRDADGKIKPNTNFVAETIITF
ncbi:MAG TPA: hypothetical protein VLM37_13385 [Fibrobacteraceae bacterium]|nr:hypothetical protein [Fibrobacteraceae bacterium]